MKGIKELLYETQIYDLIDDSIIDELYCLNSIKLQLNEGSGLYPGQVQTTKFIYDQILKNKDFNNMEITKFPSLKNKFFNKIIITFNDSENYEGGYVVYNGNELSWNEAEKIFNYIEFSFSVNSLDNLYSIIIHELKHAYRDWMNLKTGKSSIYKKILDISYDKIVNINANDSPFLKTAKILNYFLTDFEHEAVIDEMIESLNNEYFTLNEAIEDLNKMQKYKGLKSLYNNVQYILSNENAFKLYCKEYNTLFNENENKIKNELTVEFNRKWTKFINHLYNGIYDKVFKRTKTVNPKNINIETLKK